MGVGSNSKPFKSTSLLPGGYGKLIFAAVTIRADDTSDDNINTPVGFKRPLSRQRLTIQMQHSPLQTASLDKVNM